MKKANLGQTFNPKVGTKGVFAALNLPPPQGFTLISHYECPNKNPVLPPTCNQPVLH